MEGRPIVDDKFFHTIALAYRPKGPAALAKLAAEVEGLFARKLQGAGRYAGWRLCRTLCQGAAVRYLSVENGLKYFDIWSFYGEHADGPFPYRWRGNRIIALQIQLLGKVVWPDAK